MFIRILRTGAGVLVMCWLCLDAVAGETAKSELISGVDELRRSSGFLLLKLNSKADHASIRLSSRYGKKTYALSAREDGYFIITLPKGTYVIDELRVPYFDFPYILDTSEDPRWKFSIVPGSLNYIGELEIDRDRTVTSVSENITNRSALHYKEFCSLYPAACTEYPFRFAADYRDDFTTILQGVSQ